MAEPNILEALLEEEIEKSLNEISSDICQDSMQDSMQYSLINVQAKTQKIKLQLQQELADLRKKCRNGLQNILQALSELPETETALPLETLQENLQKSFSKVAESIESLLSYADQVSKGASWCELLGLDEKMLSTLYRGAKSLEERARYEEAEEAFTFLVSLDGTESYFWIHLGLAEVHLNKFDAAIKAYSNAVQCDPSFLWPHIHLANCFELMQDYSQAAKEIEEALQLYVDDPERDRELEEALQERLLYFKNRAKSM